MGVTQGSREVILVDDGVFTSQLPEVSRKALKFVPFLEVKESLRGLRIQLNITTSRQLCCRVHEADSGKKTVIPPLTRRHRSPSVITFIPDAVAHTLA